METLITADSKIVMFNRFHQLVKDGVTFAGVSERLDQLKKAYRMLISQTEDFQAYVQSYEKGFVLYQAYKFVECFPFLTRNFQAVMM